MKILLLGANGQVGGELRRSLAPLGDIVLATRAGLLDGVACERADFDQPDSLSGLVERVSPDIVVNAAAYTAVDRAEQDSDAAFRANAEAPQRIAQACGERGVLLVHYSTDYVFDGASARPYREHDSPSPLGIYGASKLAGEEAVRVAATQHLIFRTSWVYGARGHNFLLTMLRLGAERDELRVVGDQIGSPTPAYLIADLTTEAIVRHLQSGTYHLTASGKSSWHGFAEAIMAKAVARNLLSRAPRVVAIPTRCWTIQSCPMPWASGSRTGKLDWTR
jgi:dTDP-4-dehydrorhamnose reductase